jgi:hypothetical protein
MAREGETPIAPLRVEWHQYERMPHSFPRSASGTAVRIEQAYRARHSPDASPLPNWFERF